MLQDHIWKAYCSWDTAPRAYSKHAPGAVYILNVVLQDSYSIFDSENSFRLLMVQDYFVIIWGQNLHKSVRVKWAY